MPTLSLFLSGGDKEIKRNKDDSHSAKGSVHVKKEHVEVSESLLEKRSSEKLTSKKDRFKE